MKYFLTLIGVAAFVALVFAFNGDVIGNNVLEFGNGMKINKGVVSVFGKGKKGNGDVIDQKRTIDAFSSVRSSNAIKVELIKGDSPKVVVRTDSNLQENIKTVVKDGKLRIYVKGSIRKYHIMKVFVTFTELERLSSSSASEIIAKDKIVADSFSLSASSASSIEIRELEANEVDVDISSAANIELAGKCEKLKVEASSASDADLYDLKANVVEVDASSAADVNVCALVKLDAEASSGADVNYKGTPERLSTEENSGGDISKR